MISFLGQRKPSTVTSFLVALAVIAAAGVATGLETFPASAGASCDIEEATNGTNVQHAGGAQWNITDFEGVKSDLWNYNPTSSQVWDGSLFSIFAQKSDGSEWAQIGWWKNDTESNSIVFFQLTNDGSGFITRYYNATSDSWQSGRSGAASPTSSKLYSVHKESGSFNFQYDGGATASFSRTWTPDSLVVAGETFTYQSVTPGLDRGDHHPGDTSNKIQANNVKKLVNGSWSNASLSNLGGNGNGSFDFNNGSGSGVRVWDVRCSD